MYLSVDELYHDESRAVRGYKIGSTTEENKKEEQARGHEAMIRGGCSYRLFVLHRKAALEDSGGQLEGYTTYRVCVQHLIFSLQQTFSAFAYLTVCP